MTRGREEKRRGNAAARQHHNKIQTDRARPQTRPPVGASALAASPDASQETNQTLQAIIQASPVAVIALDREGVIKMWNPAAERIYGWSAQEVLGRPLPTVPPERQEQMRRDHQQALKGQNFINHETQQLRKDGARIDVSISTAPLLDADGTASGVIALVNDITERKRAEGAQRFLSDATALLSGSLDYKLTLERLASLSVPTLADYCLVDMLDENGAIRRMTVAHQDPACAELWREMQRRFPLDPQSPYTIPKVLRTGQAEIFPEPTDELLQSMLTDQAQIAALKRFGIKSSMIVPLLARGRTLGAISFISAESGRLYRADDLALAEELGRRAALALDNARLYRRAKETNRLKDEFLATLSHELRTPLTPIIGWVHMMSAGQLSPRDMTHGLSVIDKNSQSLSHLINDLLDMSAIINGKMRIDRAPLELRMILKEAIETVRPQATERGIDIEFARDGDERDESDHHVMISGDRMRLVQVFWNLLHNAVKFSGEGAQVCVSCESGARTVRVCVEDRGQGIAPDFLPRVFERFQQADGSTTRAHGGLGIGLALVKSFIEAHGGTVAADSEGLGRGSRFIVNLPRLPAPATTPPADDSGALTSRTAMRPRHLLIVEDVADTSELLRLVFATRGFRTTACTSAEQALDVAASGQHFDIIISDIGLPHIDGYELLKRLKREFSSLRDAPAIALSGYAAHTDVIAALTAGFDVHLAKPVDPDMLVKVVELLLERRRADARTDKGSRSDVSSLTR